MFRRKNKRIDGDKACLANLQATLSNLLGELLAIKRALYQLLAKEGEK